MNVSSSKIDEIIVQINKKLNQKFNEKIILNEKNTNIVWMIVSDNERFVIRERICNEKSIKNLFHYGAFLTEILVYKGLSTMDFKRLNYPKLLLTDMKNYIVLENIDYDTTKSDFNNVNKKDLIGALLEFQLSSIFER